MTHSLDLCIVNHEGATYLGETLSAVNSVSHCFDRILLVDNASTDESVAMVNALSPDIEVIALEQNFGPGIARNAGFSNSNARRLLFIDNDVSLNESCIKGLGEVLDEYPLAAFVMPRVVYDARRSVIQYDGAATHFTGLMVLENADTPIARASTEPRVINSLVTACFMMDRERWGVHAPFDDMFFYIFEDHELGLRARMMGHHVMACPAVHVHHRDGALGLSLRETGTYTSIRVRNTILNRWKVILKLFQRRSLLLLSPALLAFEVFQLAGVLAKGWFRHWLFALSWSLRNARLIIHRRRAFQRERQVPDRELLSGGPLPFTAKLTQSRLERFARSVLENVLSAWWHAVRSFL